MIDDESDRDESHSRKQRADFEDEQSSEEDELSRAYCIDLAEEGDKGSGG
jgi:hypothetical protein